MSFRISLAALCTVGAVLSVYAGDVVFHNPVQWTTLRSSSVEARASVDTTGIAGKKLFVSLNKWSNGNKTLVAADTVVLKDVSYEHNFNAGNSKLLGGTDFLSLDWQLDTTKKSGTIQPIGLAIVSDDAAPDVSAKHVSDSYSLDSLLPDSAGKQSVGSAGLVYRWNKQGLFIRVGTSADSATARLLFDCKNGKNAFHTFADRKISVSFPADTVDAEYEKHAINKSVLSYSDAKWVCEIKTKSAKKVVAIFIPWYDLGMKSAEGRIIGFSAGASGAKGSFTYSQKQVIEDLPATWGSLLLKK